MSQQELIPSGVPRFDALLGGGVPPRQMLILVGNPGTGKTVLAGQMGFAAAARGSPVVIATVSGEPHSKLLQSLESFTFFDRARVGKEIFIVSAYPWVKKGGREARDVLLGSVKDRKARLLIIDGLRGVRDLWQDESQLREFYAELGVGLATHDCAGLFTLESGLAQALECSEAAIADGLIALSQPAVGMQRQRRVEVVKLRGRPHLSGEHALKIGSDGAQVTPRLEALERSRCAPALSEMRATMGLQALDERLGGGLPVGSSTLVFGASGAGKSLLAAHFLAAGAEKGEVGLLLSFQESAASLAGRARQVGLELTQALETRKLLVRQEAPYDVDPDAVAIELLEQVRSCGVRRLVVDGLGALERALVQDPRRHDFLAALSCALQAVGVTALWTVEAPPFWSVQRPLPDTGMSNLADGWICLGQVERDGRLERTLSVMKLRSGAHAWTPAAYEISRRGFQFASGAQRGHP